MRRPISGGGFPRDQRLTRCKMESGEGECSAVPAWCVVATAPAIKIEETF